MEYGYHYKKLLDFDWKRLGSELMQIINDAARERFCKLAQIRGIEKQMNKGGGPCSNSLSEISNEDEHLLKIKAYLDLIDKFEPRGASLFELLKIFCGTGGGAWGPSQADGSEHLERVLRVVYAFSSVSIIDPVLAEDMLFSFIFDFKLVHDSCEHPIVFASGAVMGLFDLAKRLLPHKVEDKLCEALIALSPALAGYHIGSTFGSPKSPIEKPMSNYVLAFLKADGVDGPKLAKRILESLTEKCGEEKLGKLHESSPLKMFVSRLCFYICENGLKNSPLALVQALTNSKKKR